MVEDDEYELSNGDTPEQDIQPSSGLTRSQAWNLYVSHALSTWNARGYEFAAILFTAAAFPDTLVAAAARMIIIYFAMILFSSSIGRWVDRSPNRLRTLLSTIVCNRGSVVVGSFFWLLILSQEDVLPPPHPTEESGGAVFSLPSNRAVKAVGFALAVGCGIVERLSASGNLISMERDWVVTVAAPSGQQQRYDLTHLNAAMRRIDLVCKLFAPIAVSAVISAWGSARVGVLFTALTSLASLPIEAVSARRVWKSSPSLQAPKPVPPPPPPPQNNNNNSNTAPRSGSFVMVMARHLRQYLQGFEMYFATPVWLPSVALALLHFNMMTWRATFITSLINVGYSLNVITIARTVGSVFEISSTIVTPRGIAYLGRKTSQQKRRRGQVGAATAEEEDEAGVALIGEEEGGEGEGKGEDENEKERQTIVGLERFGLWGFTWQLLFTIPVVLAIWAIYPHSDPDPTTPTPQPPWGWSLALFAFLALSRFGVWIFDLTTQQLTQTPSLVPAHRRSTFAGVEASVVNLFELLGAAAAVALPATRQFPLLALASFGAVLAGWVMYVVWLRGRRGHLVHWEKIGWA
ncbi:hypothetical protein SLS62_000164 [Diatrype stigma]|uniref:Solute carrier family 40 member n=1 Tax=Diatrype stigma TaxID=117547 RepID=A0AAN9V207_9PEZI